MRFDPPPFPAPDALPARKVIPIVPESADAGPAAAREAARYAAHETANKAANEAANEAAPDAAFGACSGAESFALRVLGDSMQPEFDDGDVVIIEPGGLATDGAFVLAQSGGGWGLRLLRRDGDRWLLSMLNSTEPAEPIADLAPVRGVVIQKSKPGRRRAGKRYVD